MFTHVCMQTSFGAWFQLQETVFGWASARYADTVFMIVVRADFCLYGRTWKVLREL
uniref:Uncharacterized protein n=1 Tax=Rhizophora mucronata TaxID=61149 RepID=A0A2P2N9E5_RHIMU